MGLNLGSIYQQPYIRRDQASVKRKKDEDGSKSAAQTSREEQASQNSRSKGLQYVENNQDGFVRNSATSNANSGIQSQPWQKEVYQNAQAVRPQGTSQNYTPVNTSINIAQILKDFNNTAIAIGTPDDLKEEVDGYLELVEKQVKKDNPNTKLVKSNLKNASTILDGYISKTLDKDSNVVGNWVDALFMQDIDFSYDENDINPQFLVKFPKGSTDRAKKSTKAEEVTPQVEEPALTEEIPQAQTSAKVHVPQDKELKSLFIKSKKLASADDPQKAIESFEKALNRATEVGDNETKSKIYYEIGKIYDDYDYPTQALKSFHESIQNTTDDNIKTRAHYSMAQIYDEVNQIEPALDHYFVSVAYGGESNNPAVQSTAMAKMGNIFSDMYDDEAFNYLNIAKDVAYDTDNSKVKGFVSSSLGRAYEKFGEPQEALKSYSEAVKNYTEAESPLKTAQNYLSAADIMIGFESKNKARGLLNKAKIHAQNAGDENLISEINERLERLAVG